MDTRLMGSLAVSPLGLGCNNFGRKIDQSAEPVVVRTAFESGITFFDTADRYGVRRPSVLGTGPLGGVPREEVAALN